MNLAVKFNLLKIHNHIIVIHQKVVWKMIITNYIFARAGVKFNFKSLLAGVK
jgi:hypothetical protein